LEKFEDKPQDAPTYRLTLEEKVTVSEYWSDEYWSTGVLEYWSTGVLEYWSTGVLEYWSIGVLE
jgi:hypothetical protein